jgi:hypothetical protein
MKWVFVGPQGLRTGWMTAIFLLLSLIFMAVLGIGVTAFVSKVLHVKTGQFTAPSAMIAESIEVLGILAAGAICARIERRRIQDYNLTGPRRSLNFLTGVLAGFGALSLLVGALDWGGWLHFGPVALTGVAVLEFGGMWGVAFLLTGFFEEGSMRCYLQFTLTRGINFWWALGLVSAMCLNCLLFIHNEGVWGIYAMAALGVGPCLLLHLRKAPGAGFWQAAWVTSTFFGFIHTGNHGENWIGIFSASAIGFIFCVSIRLTGSAWWAIGFHASWDWAQTFFYGTPDSGFASKGHLLTTSPTGAPLWSGGQDGPEGSLLILPTILITLLYVVAVYGRRGRLTIESPTAAAQPQLS